MYEAKKIKEVNVDKSSLFHGKVASLGWIQKTCTRRCARVDVRGKRSSEERKMGQLHKLLHTPLAVCRGIMKYM